MAEDRDEYITSIAEALRPLPAVDGEAKARVLLAVAAERERDRQAPSEREPRPWLQWISSGAAVAAGIMWLLFMREPVSSPNAPAMARHARAASAASASAAAEGPATLAANDPATMDVAPVPVQLVFRAPEASRVAIVGDFNGWSKEKDFMTRDAASGLWSTTLNVRPGRHVYAFVVNDTQWVRDPRAVAAPDADFGRPGSVLLVSKP